MPFVYYTFTDQQLVDIRRFCGYPALGDGNVVFPYPWIMQQFLALEYRLTHLGTDEGNTVVTTYLTPMYAIETDLSTINTNLDTAQAGSWQHNPNEMRDKVQIFDWWRRRLCTFLDVPPGPNLASGGNSMRMVV